MDGLCNVLIEEILSYAKMPVETKRGLFLKLCSLNYLNALVKKRENKGVLSYWMIKPEALQLAIDLIKNGKSSICEEIYVKEEEDCLYIRCYGLQFSFHHINVKMIVKDYPQLCNPNAIWDGVKLQSIAEPLYSLANDSIKENQNEETIKSRIKTIMLNAKLQN